MSRLCIFEYLGVRKGLYLLKISKLLRDYSLCDDKQCGEEINKEEEKGVEKGEEQK